MYMPKDVWANLLSLGPNEWGSEMTIATEPPKMFCGFDLTMTEAGTEFKME